MYSLHFPFVLPMQKIDNYDQPISFSVSNDLDLVFTLKSLDKDSAFYSRKYILTVDGFLSKEQAIEYEQKIWLGMIWVLFQQDAAFEVGFNKGSHFNLKFFSSICNKEVRDNKKPSVYSTDSKPGFISGSGLRIIPGISFNNYMKGLIEGMIYPNVQSVLQDDKLILALELYNQYFFEASKRAQFLSLVTSLEVLSKATKSKATKEEKESEEKEEKGNNIICELIDDWVKSLDKKIESTDDNNTKGNLIKFKTQRLEKLKTITIEKQIKKFVYRTLKSKGYSNKKAKSKANKALEIYNTRSELVHYGKTDNSKLEEHHSSCKELVKELLESLIKNKDNNHSQGE